MPGVSAFGAGGAFLVVVFCEPCGAFGAAGVNGGDLVVVGLFFEVGDSGDEVDDGGCLGEDTEDEDDAEDGH
jgi:hypothetical protein